MSYLNEKGRSLGVGVIYSLFFWLFALCTYFGAYLVGDSWVYGVILMVVAIVLSFLGGKCKPLYLAAIALNCIGTGFIAAFYYTALSIPLMLTDALLAALLGVLLLAIFSVISQLVKEGRALLFAAYAIVLVAVLVFVAILWGTAGGAFYPMLFFVAVLLVVSTILLAVTTAGREENELLRDCAYASFGILVTVGIIVAVLVGGDGCDCDGCDCCDCGDLGGKKKKKRN